VHDCLLKVHIETVTRDKASFLECLHSRLPPSCRSQADPISFHVCLRAQNALQEFLVAVLRVQVKLANRDIFELFWWPPRVGYGFQERSRSEDDLLWHFINAWLACHPEWHVQVHGVSQDELVGGSGALAEHVWQRISVLIERDDVNEVDAADHGRGRVPCREGGPVLANERVMLLILSLKLSDLARTRLFGCRMDPERSTILR